MKFKGEIFIVLRYTFLLLIALTSISFIYSLFTPITLYASTLLLKILGYQVLVTGTSEFFTSGVLIRLIPACIGGSAYFLLFSLNLTTPMPLKTRVKSLLFLLFSFFIINILRISLFSVLSVSNPDYFTLGHKFVWYFGSTALVLILWFFNVYILKIKSIPVYTDFKYLLKNQ